MLAFTLSLDDFVISFFTSGPSSVTLPLYIYGSLRRGITPDIHALSTHRLPGDRGARARAAAVHQEPQGGLTHEEARTRASCRAALAACSKQSGGTSPAARALESRARDGSVTVFMYSEYIDPALVERFQKETGLKVVLDTYENTETMMSKVASAGDQYDVVVVSDHAIPTMAAKGTFRPLDMSKIPNAKNVDRPVRETAPTIRREGAACPTSGAPWAWSTARTSSRSFTPSWAAVLDPARQPGPVVLHRLDARPDGRGALLRRASRRTPAPRAS